MTQLFMEVLTETLVRRGTKGMGTQSPDSTYVNNGYYPVVDEAPDYDSSLQYLTYIYVKGIEIYTKEYTVVDFTEVELYSKKLVATTNSISAIEVEHVPENESIAYVFAGHKSAQSDMITALGLMNGSSSNKTQNWFDTSGTKVKLTSNDFNAILGLIEPIQEAITDI